MAPSSPDTPRRTQATTRSPSSRRASDGGRGVKRREAEVLEAATTVFYERGYADASVQAVADELGILKGSLYHYIKTKEDLLYWLLEDVHDDVQGILDEINATEGLAPLDRLALYVHKQAVYNATNLPRIAIYYHDVEQLSPERLTGIRRRRKEHEQFVTDCIAEAQERGEASKHFEAKLLANCVFGTMIWVYRWYSPRGRLSREGLGKLVSEFCLRGVVGPPA